jgi:flagellar M-ring protein FliF
MGFLGQTMTSIKDLFGSMTPAARLTTAMLLGVILVSSVFLFRVQTGEADSYLFGGRAFSNREIDAMITAFSKAELNDWEPEGNRISVPKSKRHLYLAALADGEALPEKFDGYLEDIISTSNPFQSREQFETQKRYAVQGDLATIVRAMNGIEMATVKITEQKLPGLSRDRKTMALVAVRGAGSTQLTPEQVEDIRAMVALASGAAPTNVTVSDLQGRTFPGGENGTSAFGNEYAKAKRYHEHEWRRKIEAVLTHVQGAVVGIDVTLDKVQSNISYARNVSQPQPLRQENRSTKSYVRSPSGGGQPGALSNDVLPPNSPTSVAGGSGTGGRESEETNQFDLTESAVSTEDIQKREIGLTPDFVSASILVPKSYIRRIWDDSNPPKPDADPADPQIPSAAELKQIEEAETEKIRRLVDRLLPPIDDGSDKWPRIEVSTYVDLPTTEPDALSSSTAAMGWLAGNWQMLATFFIGIMALMMVRSALKPAGSVDGSPEGDVDGDGDDLGSRLAEDESSDDDLNMLKLRRGDDGPSLKEELTDLVRYDPDAAASVLSQWIVNSS